MNHTQAKEKAPSGADLYAFVGGTITYFYKEGDKVFFMSGRQYLHVSITRFYKL